MAILRETFSIAFDSLIAARQVKGDNHGNLSEASIVQFVRQKLKGSCSGVAVVPKAVWVGEGSYWVAPYQLNTANDGNSCA